jgi:hypothetical protein
MWRALRITVLLLVLLVVAGQAWLDRFSTTRWQRTVYVGAFPVSADASTATARYLTQLDQGKIDEVDSFLKSEARRYGVGVMNRLSWSSTRAWHCRLRRSIRARACSRASSGA